MSEARSPARDNFVGQAEACRRLGSPFTAALCELLAERLDDSSRFGARLLNWPATASDDALALRAAGALHALARSGGVPELSRAYPPHPFDKERLWAGIAAAMVSHDAFLHDYLDSPPQTNEVARSAILLGGYLELARAFGLPFEVLELGSSAGLNLLVDQYRYDLGEAGHWGDPQAGVVISCEWRGSPPPLDQRLDIRSRAGCDRNPLDPASDEARARLMSYIWADQDARQQRIAAALGLAERSGIRPVRADAAEWLERALALPQVPHHLRLVQHSIVWQYLPEQTRKRITAAMDLAGSSAAPATPLAWLRFENDGGSDGAAIELTSWPGGETRQLGRGDFHGRWADWTGA